MTTTQCTCTGCAVQQGTHQPAEALHQQIDEPQAEAMRLADECDESATHWVHEIDTRFKAAKMLRAQQARIAELEASESRTIAQRDHCEEVIDRMADAVLGKDRPEWSSAYDFMDAAQEVDDRIAELEAQLDAIGAGGVEPLRKPAAAPQAVQAAVPEAIEQMAVDRYKVVPSHESMFHRWAVVADNGTQQLYIGREVECLNMARKFAGAFLDGAFVAMQNTTTAHPAEGVPAQAAVPAPDERAAFEQWLGIKPCGAAHDFGWAAWQARAALAATQPAAQGMDALPMQASEGVEDVAAMEHPEWMLVHKETGAQKPLDSQWTVRATQPAAQGAATTGYIAPKGRYVPPVLFSPYTGEPRDARDIASDPRGILIVPPGAALAAQAKQGGAA